MSTSAERHAKFRAAARSAGRRQLGTWISREAWEHLDALLLETGERLDVLVSRAILAYRPGVAKDVSTNVARNTPAVARNAARNARTASSNGAGLDPEVKELVLAWRAEGESWAECARRLDECGIPPPRGGSWLQGRGQTNLNRYFR